jgi:hypothetical protein
MLSHLTPLQARQAIENEKSGQSTSTSGPRSDPEILETGMIIVL